MGISIPTVYHKVAAYSFLFILLYPSQMVYSSQSNKVRCNPGQINHDTAPTKCPTHQICTAHGVCELLGQDLDRVQRKRHFSPLQGAASKPFAIKEGRCGEHFGDAKYDSKSKFRSCCSWRGWCGALPAYCGPENGCQQGCNVDPELTIQRRETRDNDTEQTSEPLINFFDRVGTPIPAPRNEAPGDFKVVGDSGVPAMHTALMPNGNVVFLDKIENHTKLQVDKRRVCLLVRMGSSFWQSHTFNLQGRSNTSLCFLSSPADLVRQMPSAAGARFLLQAPWSLLAEWTFTSCCTLYFEWLRRNTLSYTQFVI
jgi:hypothetical protein